MTNLSIFAKRAFLSTDPGKDFIYKGINPKRGYLKGVSSIIRADQIAKRVGAKLNPKKDYKNDIVIYVKPNLDPKGDFKFEGKRTYLDVIDEWGYVEVLKKHPKVSAIILSERDYTNLSEVVNNNVVLIPQHHCNFNREIRTRSGVVTLGVIGNKKAFSYLPANLKAELTKRGLQLIEFSEFFNRKDVVDFYKKIDLQVVWRPYQKKLANPLKIVNAASFGIPTIALDEIYFKEMGNAYIGVRNFEHFLIELDRLCASKSLYGAYAGLCLEKAERYHIKNIAKLYEKLIV